MKFPGATLAVLLAASALALTSCAPATATFSGSLSKPHMSFFFPELDVRHAAGDMCDTVGTYEYPDVTMGTQVTLRDSTGATVGLTQLQAGVLLLGYDESRDRGNGRSAEDICIFSFEFTEVESQDKFFTIEIGLRGEVSFAREDLVSGFASVSLGKP